MMPSTSVSPAASRNSIRPSCSPFRSCSAARVALTASLHRAFAHVRIGVVPEHRAHGLVGDAALRILLDDAQVVVLYRVLVAIELERPAHGLELGRGECRAQRLLVLEIAAYLAHRGV